MAERLAALRARLEAVGEAARARSFWIVLPLTTLAVVGVAGVTGSAALTRAESWRARAAELRATSATVETWREELVEPPPAESAAWGRSRRAARGLGIEPGDRIALMQVVAQRAEELGLADVSVGFVDADTLELETFREVGDAVFDAAPYALQLRVRAGYEAVGSLIGSLPPPVAVHRLRLSRDDQGVTAALTLVVFLRESS